MIGIEFIDASNMRTFAERLEVFMNDHPDAKILFGQVKGIEGGKGVFAILSYKKELIPLESGHKTTKLYQEVTESVQKKIDAEAELKMQQAAEARKKAAEQLKKAQEELEALG